MKPSAKSKATRLKKNADLFEIFKKSFFPGLAIFSEITSRSSSGKIQDQGFLTISQLFFKVQATRGKLPPGFSRPWAVAMLTG